MKMIWNQPAQDSELLQLRMRVDALELELERMRAEYRTACESLAEALDHVDMRLAAMEPPA